jgi:ribokinase
MSAVEVLVVGDANPDLVLTGDTVPRFGQAEQLLEAADLVLGGSAAIVACGLARLDVPTALVAVVGSDRFGAVVLDALVERGVDVSTVAVDADRPTGLSVILAQPGDRAILTLPGTIPALDAPAVRAAVERLEPRHVHLASYFLLPGLAADTPALLAWLSARGVSTSIDTNWDPAERWDGVAEVLAAVDVLLPNAEEALAIAQAVTGEARTDADAACAALSLLGCRVALKAGAEGGRVFAEGREIARASGLAVDVVDTVGAGDSFDAGYLAALATGEPDEAVRVRWAAAAGSLSVRGAGGTAAQATAAELHEILRDAPAPAAAPGDGPTVSAEATR